MKKFLLGLLIFIAVGGVGLVVVKLDNDLTVIFLDIGQGDAALVKTPHGQNILIDGGPDRTILTKLEKYLPWTERTIDLMVLSHPHADHVAGLNYVLERYQVRHILMTEAVHTTPEYLRFLQLIKEKDIPTSIAVTGQRFDFGGDVSLEVVWPNQSLAGFRLPDLNAGSVVNKVAYGRTAALFTGDTPLENEAAMLRAGLDVSAQVLKVAHQGSKTSSGEEFLRAVGAEFAVIPVGPNRYGHPHAEVVERLRQIVPKVLRTDQAGDIIFVSNGQNFKLQPLSWWQAWFRK